VTAPKVTLLDDGTSPAYWNVEVQGRTFSFWVPNGEPSDVGRACMLAWYRCLLDPRLPLDPMVAAICAVRQARRDAEQP
jgi:hypothetical protein